MEAKDIFTETDAHLLTDKQPSLYFQSLDEQAFIYPFTMLSRLKTVPQSPQYHPEGNVWNHTMLVIDEAAARREQAGDGRAFMWAALLHDIGKAVTTRRRKGKITAYDHEKAGADMAREFLSGFAGEEFTAKVCALVRWHMQILFMSKKPDIKQQMKREADINDIALLGLCDRLGRKGINRREEEQKVRDFLKNASAK